MTTQHPMELAMVGLGRMGANIVRRLMRDGHRCVVFDVNADAVAELVAEGAIGSTSLADMTSKMTGPRAIWMMVPAGITGDILEQVAAVADAGDTIIDGGNSYYRDDIDRAAGLKERGIHYVDCGTSGGVWGLERGYCLMIGGEDAPVARLDPIWRSIAPGVGTGEPTPLRDDAGKTAQDGYLHCGPSGAGHFVKMVHNGVEYGMMAAISEGLSIIKHAGAGLHTQEIDAETTPLRDPQYYQFQIDIPEVAEVWRRGSVIGSWLMDLTAGALARSPELSEFTGRVSDSGEGRWTVLAAVEEGVPAPAITSALYSRFDSRGLGEFSGKVMSAMRSEFGGHDEKPTDKPTEK